MSVPASTFKNRSIPMELRYTNGLPTQILSNQSNGGDFGLRPAAYFTACTGNVFLADVAYNQSSPTVLVPASAVPSNMRCYLTRVDVDVQGKTPWAGGVYAMIQDTNGSPGIYLPTASLVGLAGYTFPDSDAEVPILATASAYNSSTGVITLPASTLINAAYSNNCVATVVGGTGIGQSCLIGSNTTTTITPALGAAAFLVPLDNTSVIAVWYWAATTCSTTVETFSNAAFTVNALDNGFSVVDVAGATPGKNRPIASNTSTAATVAYAFNTSPTVGDLFEISNNPTRLGGLDLCVADKWAAFQPNAGVQVALGGTFTQGSPLRIYVEGFFAY
jgi:hypothetical protein